MKQLKIDGVHVLIEKDDSPSFMFTAVGWVDMIFGIFLDDAGLRDVGALCSVSPRLIRLTALRKNVSVN